MILQNSLVDRALPVPEAPSLNTTIPNVPDRLWAFLKGSWKGLLGLALGLGLLGFLWFHMQSLASNSSALKADLLQQRQTHAEEIRQVTESFQRQQEAQAAIDRKFEDRLQVLSEQYEEALRGVARARRTRQRQIEENPSTLPGVFESTFGIRPLGQGEQE